MWLKDPKTKEKSVTLTLFVIAFVIACVKLLIANMVINKISLGAFTGTDFAAVVGAAGAIYTARKYTDAPEK